MAKYNTKQKQILLDYLYHNRDKCLSVNEILEHNNTTVGQTTIYRYLNELEKDKKIVKYQNEIGTSRTYQYVDDDHCQIHFHLKCSDCGTLVHLDCHSLNDLKNHIQNDHNFQVDQSKTTIYGQCCNCRKGK